MSNDICFEDKAVLLVEDELFLVERISNQLNSLGVGKVHTATSLADANQHVQCEDIDIALLDINLPNGETTETLGEELMANGVAVVFFSGFNVSDSAIAMGAHEFLEKPLSVSRLKASMQRAMLRTPSSAERPQTKMAGPETRQSG